MLNCTAGNRTLDCQSRSFERDHLLLRSAALAPIPSRTMNPGELAPLRRNIYIDVDGVCLRSASSSLTGIEPAPHCFAFLQWAVDSHRPHWLTTRDAHGQHDGILRAFKLAMGCAMLPNEIDGLVRSVEPTTWSGNKTFGIDLSSDFVWIDDAPLGFEIDALRSRGLLDRLIVIDTNKDDVGLLRAIDAINSLSKSR